MDKDKLFYQRVSSRMTLSAAEILPMKHLQRSLLVLLHHQAELPNPEVCRLFQESEQVFKTHPLLPAHILQIMSLAFETTFDPPAFEVRRRAKDIDRAGPEYKQVLLWAQERLNQGEQRQIDFRVIQFTTSLRLSYWREDDPWSSYQTRNVFNLMTFNRRSLNPDSYLEWNQYSQGAPTRKQGHTPYPPWQVVMQHARQRDREKIQAEPGD